MQASTDNKILKIHSYVIVTRGICIANAAASIMTTKFWTLSYAVGIHKEYQDVRVWLLIVLLEFDL